ncbi:MAG: cupin domain-containing protein [Eubacteriales bacterium]
MTGKYIKNINTSEVLELAAQVEYQSGQIVSRTLAQNKSMNLTLFAFDKGEEISSHDSSGDAFVLCLDGEGEITVGEGKHILKAGQVIIMPAKIPHAVFAKERFKMMLTVVFPA